ncbi:hypothetical protein ADUPG1_007661 [Aduncisulcus paluster]|uniref:Uncharacterized protein n=1 Tax=Aduncisulcus paluster TaxID=2918883 RepID=A0ABQ5KP53_9EUKA|nr:hypothetical protein ADUPG1_007661 [Aduncisulcus paluster]
MSEEVPKQPEPPKIRNDVVLFHILIKRPLLPLATLQAHWNEDALGPLEESIKSLRELLSKFGKHFSIKTFIPITPKAPRVHHIALLHCGNPFRQQKSTEAPELVPPTRFLSIPQSQYAYRVMQYMFTSAPAPVHVDQLIAMRNQEMTLSQSSSSQKRGHLGAVLSYSDSINTLKTLVSGGYLCRWDGREGGIAFDSHSAYSTQSKRSNRSDNIQNAMSDAVRTINMHFDEEDEGSQIFSEEEDKESRPKDEHEIMDSSGIASDHISSVSSSSKKLSPTDSPIMLVNASSFFPPLSSALLSVGIRSQVELDMLMRDLNTYECSVCSCVCINGCVCTKCSSVMCITCAERSVDEYCDKMKRQARDRGDTSGSSLFSPTDYASFFKPVRCSKCGSKVTVNSSDMIELIRERREEEMKTMDAEEEEGKDGEEEEVVPPRGVLTLGAQNDQASRIGTSKDKEEEEEEDLKDLETEETVISKKGRKKGKSQISSSTATKSTSSRQKKQPAKKTKDNKKAKVPARRGRKKRKEEEEEEEFSEESSSSFLQDGEEEEEEVETKTKRPSRRVAQQQFVTMDEENSEGSLIENDEESSDEFNPDEFDD